MALKKKIQELPAGTEIYNDSLFALGKKTGLTTYILQKQTADQVRKFILKKFFISILFKDVLPFNYVASEPMKIVSIENPNGMTLEIKVNGVVYVLGDPIAVYDEIDITTDIVGFLKLNCER